VWKGERPVTYQVDVITESYLPSFLRLVEEEIREVIRSAVGKKQAFGDTVNRMVTDYRENRTDRPTWRQVVEYVG
jgi:hypothetical protein